MTYIRARIEAMNLFLRISGLDKWLPLIVAGMAGWLIGFMAHEIQLAIYGWLS